MAATTGTQLITNAMIEARIIHPAETIPSGKSDHALGKLNDMLESWSLNELRVPYDVLEDFALTVGQNEYTYGTGGDFDSARPISIKDECFVRSGSIDYPCKFYHLSIYRERYNKSTSRRPEVISYNEEYPLGKVFLWPTPVSTDSIYIRASKIITSFATAATSVDLMPGYRRAIIACLALELLSSYGKKASQSLVAVAQSSLQAIMSANSKPTKPMKTELRSLLGGSRGGTIQDGPY